MFRNFNKVLTKNYYTSPYISKKISQEKTLGQFLHSLNNYKSPSVQWTTALSLKYA